MSAAIKAQRRPLSRLDRAIIALHGVVAVVFGIIGFLEADDPGWRDLQRFVIVMLVGLWVSGIVVVGVLARLVGNQVVRAVLLLAGPLLGIALLIGASTIG
ncbi:MAG: hypothetical protein HKO82_12825 [Acidimicrobiia bacterium]|nr:hypothetical protein [Acidimicrobiia bacterium]NNL70993.1 hypothetical protein [Acidimicrobiia bacterium]